MFFQLGGFYSAEDADSLPTVDSTKKREGAFCTWTQEEVKTLLDQPLDSKPDIKLSELFCWHFSVLPNGNVRPDSVSVQLCLINRSYRRA